MDINKLILKNKKIKKQLIIITIINSLLFTISFIQILFGKNKFNFDSFFF